MDRLDELAIFAAIADAGSLAGAAKRLRRSAPAVTRALAALEVRAGVRLVERTTRRLALTEAGRELAERARIVLGDYETAVHGLAASPVRGLLRVTAPVQFGRRHVAPLIGSYLDAYPETQVELILNDRNLDLIEEGLDVAVRIGVLAPSSSVARKLGDVRRIAVASPSYLKRRGIPRKPADLADHETIFGTLEGNAREWRFGPGNRGTVAKLSPRLIVNDVESMLLAARAGRGIARVLSYQAADDFAAGTLVRILRDYEPPPLPVHLLTQSASRRAPKLEAFLEHATARLRALAVIREERR